MEVVTLLFSQVNQVKNFVDLVTRYDFDVDLVSDRYTVNAKSMLGIYSVDLSKPVNVVIHSSDCKQLVDELKKFSVTADTDEVCRTKE